MKSQNKLAVLFLVLILIAAYFEVKRQVDFFNGFEESFIPIESLLSYLLKIFWMGIGVFSLVKFWKKKDKDFIVPTILSLGLLLTVVLMNLNWKSRESSRVVLKGIFKGDLHRTTVSLRENKTYKLADYGMYWGLTRFGEYEIHSDTIILSNDYDFGEENDFRSHKLLRKGDFLIPIRYKNGRVLEDTLSQFKVVR